MKRALALVLLCGSHSTAAGPPATYAPGDVIIEFDFASVMARIAATVRVFPDRRVVTGGRSASECDRPTQRGYIIQSDDCVTRLRTGMLQPRTSRFSALDHRVLLENVAAVDRKACRTINVPPGSDSVYQRLTVFTRQKDGTWLGEILLQESLTEYMSCGEAFLIERHLSKFLRPAAK